VTRAVSALWGEGQVPGQQVNATRTKAYTAELQWPCAVQQSAQCACQCRRQKRSGGGVARRRYAGERQVRMRRGSTSAKMLESGARLPAQRRPAPRMRRSFAHLPNGSIRPGSCSGEKPASVSWWCVCQVGNLLRAYVEEGVALSRRYK